MKESKHQLEPNKAKTFPVFTISAAKYLFALTRFLYRNSDLSAVGRNFLYLLCIYISKDDMGQTVASEVRVGNWDRNRKSSLPKSEFK